LPFDVQDVFGGVFVDRVVKNDDVHTFLGCDAQAAGAVRDTSPVFSSRCYSLSIHSDMLIIYIMTGRGALRFLPVVR
jgi:hypothetical protein